MEAGSLRPLRAAQDLSDLPLVGRSLTQGPRGRPPGAGRLLYDLAGADESAVGLLSLLQHRLSERVRQGAGTYRLAVGGAWRPLLAARLRDARRGVRESLLAGLPTPLRRPEVVPAAALPVQGDPGQRGQAPYDPQHAVLEDDQ